MSDTVRFNNRDFKVIMESKNNSEFSEVLTMSESGVMITFKVWNDVLVENKK